jgi:hypothetical protein
MSESAHVSSVEAVKAFREALCAFGVDAQGALGAAALEIRRTLDGLQARLKYWQQQVRESEEEVVRAKAALAQRRWGHSEGRGPGTTEAEIALRRAQLRLREAQEKVETVRRWQLQLPQAIHEYDGPARQLTGWLEADLQHVLALLGRRIEALEGYLALTPSSPVDVAEEAAPPCESGASGGGEPGALAPEAVSGPGAPSGPGAVSRPGASSGG